MIETPHPSRRAVLAAGAWTTPAIVLASAAPAYAGSGGTVPQVQAAVSADRNNTVFPGRSYIDITVLFTNLDPAPTDSMVAVVEVAPTLGSVFTILPIDVDPLWEFNSSSATVNDGFTARFTRRAPQLGGSPDAVSLFFRAWMNTATTFGVVRATPQPVPGVGLVGVGEWPPAPTP